MCSEGLRSCCRRGLQEKVISTNDKGKQKKGGKDERAGANLDGDLPISTNAHQFRVLAEREAVSDSLGTQQNGIEEVLIGPNAVAERLACVENERY